MSRPRPDEPRLCPECGASLPAVGGFCWLCRRDLRAATSPFAPGVAPAGRRAGYQFGIASMLLFTTLCAVVLGAFTIHPGLGIGLAILATPAALRTAILAIRRRAGGQPMSLGAKVWVFCGTLGLVAIIVAAVATAFVATCFPLVFVAFEGLSEPPGAGRVVLFFLAWALGIAVGLLVLYVLLRLFRRLWPR